MAVTNRAELLPSGTSAEPDWTADNRRDTFKISEKQKVSKKRDEMTGFMDDFILSSSKGRSPLCSRSSCSRHPPEYLLVIHLSSSSTSSISSSTSWSRSRSRSRLHAKNKNRHPEDTQDLIPGVDQDHAITDTRKDTILDITEDILIQGQDIDHRADILLDHTITGLTPQVDQEAKDTIGLEEPYVWKLI